MTQRPVLQYVEYHPTGHYNLDCKGCGDLSPFVAASVADLQSFDRDLRPMATLFSDIAKIRLVGGEP